MNKRITIKSIIVLAIVIAIAILTHSLVFAASNITTTTGINNNSPVITATVSDGGSSESVPTNVGSDVTFSATAKDINTNQYYLAVCKTQYVKAGNDAAPSCCTDSGLLTCTDSEKWAISSATNSASQASVAYTVQSGDSQSNAWYAFVCDKNTSGLCYPANGSGDPGLALGTVTFTGIPVDGATLTIDSVTYEFDTANNGVTGGNTEVDTSTAQVETNVASLLAAAEIGANSHMLNRSGVTYVYSDTKGTAGNSIGMAEAGDTGDLITLSGTNLTGGSDANASPFFVNQVPSFTTVSIGDTAGGTGAIEPDDTIYFNADVDDDGTVSMYVCASSGFTAGGTPGCTGTEICHVTGVDPANNAECDDGGSQAPVPTAHGQKDIYIYIVDNLGIEGTGTNLQHYSVGDVPMEWVSYPTAETPDLSAGGSDLVNFSAVISDDNGESDIESAEGVFFDDTAVNNDCIANHRNCYWDSDCTLNTAYGNSSQVEAQCQVQVYYNANASSNWEVHVNPTDSNGKITSFGDTNVNIDIPTLSGIDIVETSIIYGSLTPTQISSGISTSVGNAGNIVIDSTVEGTNMCSDYPTCSAYTISRAQEKWTQSLGSGFNWFTEGHTLIATSGAGDADTNGCANMDLAVRANALETTENETLYWKLRIPNNQQFATYTGLNTFASISASSCTGTP